MSIELIAPAKINLTLEVLGRRDDGYHDIVTVMQTIDLADRVALKKASSISLLVIGEYAADVPSDQTQDLAYRAAVALAAEAGRAESGVSIRLEKRIPAGMGLGGGSSDAAAVFRGLNRLWELNYDISRLSEIAERLGSDVPFFLHGGTALATGHGEQVEPLVDAKAFDLTLFLPAIEMENKTTQMYSYLGLGDWTDGNRSRALAESIGNGEPVTSGEMNNAFDRHISKASLQVDKARELCRGAGLDVVAAGSGPAFFSLNEIGRDLLRALEEHGVRAVVCRTLSRAESVGVREL